MHNVQRMVTLKSVTQSIQQKLFPWFQQVSLKNIITIFSLSCINTIRNSIPINRKVCEKMKPRGFVLH